MKIDDGEKSKMERNRLSSRALIFFSNIRSRMFFFLDITQHNISPGQPSDATCSKDLILRSLIYGLIRTDPSKAEPNSQFFNCEKAKDLGHGSVTDRRCGWSKELQKLVATYEV